MTLGRLATRRRHYGVGQLEQQRPVGTFIVLAGVATVFMVAWIVFDRLGED